MTAAVLVRRSGRLRAGLKGPRAAEWLGALGFRAPSQPNSWTPLGPADDAPIDDGPIAARLGSAEFFLEARAAGPLERLGTALRSAPPGVYPVLREDWGFALSGAGVHDLLAQVCSLDFAALPLSGRPVVMTSMIGVGVLIVPFAAAAGARRYRLWCDPSHGPYLWETLGRVVVECGGSVTGEGT